jgi:ABC-type multidrug transport system fused ATPase/permease subunit
LAYPQLSAALLAAYVEEAAAGIRVLKALGRRDEAASQHSAQARVGYQTQVSKARLRGSFWAFLDLIPNVVIGLLLLFGAIATSRHELTVGGLVAFITLTLPLVWPIEAMGIPGERAVQAALRTILAGRTALIIAHRLSTVAIADRVLVIEGGRIAEDGPPGQLLAGRGRFSALHASWRETPA